MTLSFGWAFAILLAIWFIGSILGKKTGGIGGIVGTSLFSTVVLLIGFWTNILPTDIISTAELQTFNNLVSLVLAINIVSIVEPKQLKKDWRLAVAVLAGIAGMCVMVLGVGSLFYDKQVLTGVLPVLVGGIVSTNTIVEAATAKGLDEIAAICTLFFSLQSLIGLPLISIGANMESKRLLKEYRATVKASALMKGNFVQERLPDAPVNQKVPLWDRLPKKFQTSLWPLLLAVVFGAIADSVGKLLNGPTKGIFGATSMALIIGFLAVRLGMLQKAPLAKAGVNDLFMFVAVVSLRASLGKLSFERVVSYLPMLLVIFAIAGIGMLLGGFIVGKLLGYSLGMVIAFCFGCYAGYPLNYGAAMDAVYAQAKTPEEQAMLEEEMVNRVVLGGVVGVTIASVFIGNVCAALL